jgi:hypothetical protein
VTLPFWDGFEFGNYSKWPTAYGAGTVEVITVAKHTGKFGLHCAANAGAGAGLAKDFGVANYAILYSRIYLYITTMPATGLDVIYHRGVTGATIVSYMQILNAGNFRIYTRNGAAYSGGVSSNRLLKTRQWYEFELETIIDGAAGQAHVWLNDFEETVCAVTGVDNNNYLNIETINVGLLAANGGAGDVYVDDCVISSSYIGPKFSNMMLARSRGGDSRLRVNPFYKNI